MENSGLKKIYLDIMIKGKFVCQLPFSFCPLFPIEMEEVREYVLEKRPTLKNKEFNVLFSNDKVK